MLQLWHIAGREVPAVDKDSPNGLDAELLPFAPGVDLLLITMPMPRRCTEAYFIGIVSPTAHNVQKIRYFVLSHSDADETHGPAEGCIREITADGRNFRSKDFVEPFKPDFITGVRELYNHQPGGWSCVQTTK